MDHTADKEKHKVRNCRRKAARECRKCEPIHFYELTHQKKNYHQQHPAEQDGPRHAAHGAHSRVVPDSLISILVHAVPRQFLPGGVDFVE
jgi:hypothetical protein